MSHADTFIRAKLEWETVAMWDEYNYCLCGHIIRETCLIRNIITHKEAIVGNCCVKKFWNTISIDKYFKILNRIDKNIETTIKECNFIKTLLTNKFINNWEYDFYMSIKDKSKSKLTTKQLRKKVLIHKKILRKCKEHKKILLERSEQNENEERQCNSIY
jgi:hypothetical protein